MREKNILQILRESRYTVVLSGIEMMNESGYPLLRDGEESYDIESRYGYSFEEIFSSSFYSARKELFLKAAEIPPGQGFISLKKLQDHGLVNSIITRRIAGLEERAGCTDVINLKGTVFENRCPSCGRSYPMEYMRDAKGVPLCEKCLVAIRPGVCLFGEMIDNGLMTRAAGEVEKADVLIVLGTNLNSPLCGQMIQYYTGSSLILVSEREHYSDQRADIIIHGRSDEFVNKLAEELEKEEKG